MNVLPEGTAVVYCQGAFGTSNGKTAHGLVRRTRRYQVAAVIDARCAGGDAGVVLDGRPTGIPIVPDLPSALGQCQDRRLTASHFVIGLAPDGGRLPAAARRDVLSAIDAGLHVDSGLHDFLADDPEMTALAARRGVRLRDIRRPPARDKLHSFTGKISEVTSLKVAVLGTDSAVGKRTTAWLLVDAFIAAGLSAELIGTGQTAWMQGVQFGIILDSLINDFVAGEIEHAVWSAWHAARLDVIVIEGQGSLINPAYPGGLEILAAARPDLIVLQHAPRRREYDGFPGYPIHPLSLQIQALELISQRPVAAITINHEGLEGSEIREECTRISAATGRPAFDVLRDGADELIQHLLSRARPKLAVSA
jgi:uncharacterized NAD-dependent epimerase/dehydratase family protein